MAADPRRVKQIYLAVSDAPADEQEAILSRECAGDPALRGRVEALLRARDASGSFLASPAATTASPPGRDRSPGGPPAHESGDVIAGRYTLTRRIGEGGMGEVWAAQQSEPVKRQVALKLIRAGMGSRAVLQRFEAERQALALMDHPNIARVLDGGMTGQSRPFFVMELVDGLPLNAFCDDAQLNIRTRLELFVAICQAVQHAHQKGIVHRDIKPANVLVAMVDGRPVPKVIDFGVAKAIGFDLTEQTMATQHGTVVGTLEYMSPEQAGLSDEFVDTRTDIYSLGVVLYELLTGLRPIDGARLNRAALGEMLRIIQHEEPSKPSTRLSTNESLPSLAAVRQTDPRTLTAMLRGELDWVVMKCLEKQRDRRYETANGLARDVQRYLSNEPVEARPASAGYRVRKFLQRNKVPALAAGLILLTLVGGLVGTSIGLYRAERARAAEQRQLARAEGIAAFMKATLGGAGPAVAKGRDSKLLKDLMDDAARRIAEGRLEGDPEAEAELRRTIGNVYESLGEHGAAEEQLRKAGTLIAAKFGPDSERGDEAQVDLALCLHHSGQYGEAHATATRVVSNAGKRGKPDTEWVAAALDIIGHTEYNRSGGNLDAAEKAHRRALEIRRGIYPSGTIAIGRSLNSIGFVLREQGRHSDAEPICKEALDIHRRNFGPLHPETISAACNLCDCLDVMGRLDDAETLIRPVLADAEKLLGPNHAGYADVLWRLGVILAKREDGAGALPLDERCLEIRRKVYPGPHRDVASAIASVGRDKSKLGDHTGAEAMYRESLEMRRSLFPAGSPAIASSLDDLGHCQLALGRTAEAVKTLTDAIEIRRATRAGTLELANSINGLAVARERLNELDPAIDLYREAIDLATKNLGPDHIDVAMYLSRVGAAQFRKGQKPEAEQTLRNAVTIARKTSPANTKTLGCLGNLSFVLEDRGKLTDAETIHREFLEIQSRISGPNSPPMMAGLGRLAANLQKQNRTTDAEICWRECLALREKFEPDHWATFNTKSIIGGLLIEQKKYAEAEPLLVSGYEGLKKRAEKIPPANRVGLGKAVERLVRLYDETGRPEESAKWRAEQGTMKPSK
ncbi:MAG: serine/threonine-protein kinase [Gemmataceae bacterium]|nr:serine/threonine-protein kinase [Gemmataceae bacterium]